MKTLEAIALERAAAERAARDALAATLAKSARDKAEAEKAARAKLDAIAKRFDAEAATVHAVVHPHNQRCDRRLELVAAIAVAERQRKIEHEQVTKLLAASTGNSGVGRALSDADVLREWHLAKLDKWIAQARADLKQLETEIVTAAQRDDIADQIPADLQT